MRTRILLEATGLYKEPSSQEESNKNISLMKWRAIPAEIKKEWVDIIEKSGFGFTSQLFGLDEPVQVIDCLMISQELGRICRPYVESLTNMLMNRRFCITRNGYVGLVSVNAQVGDQICIVMVATFYCDQIVS